MTGKLVPLRRISGDITEISDKALVAACGTGDAPALGALFDRFHTAVYRFAGRLALTDDLARDDLVQATFLLWRLRAVDQQRHMAVPVIGNDVPGPVLGRVQPGDLVAHFEHAWPGDLTVCVGSCAGDLMDPVSRQRSGEQLSRLTIKCKSIEPTEAVVKLAVPPQSRLE